MIRIRVEISQQIWFEDITIETFEKLYGPSREITQLRVGNKDIRVVARWKETQTNSKYT